MVVKSTRGFERVEDETEEKGEDDVARHKDNLVADGSNFFRIYSTATLRKKRTKLGEL